MTSGDVTTEARKVYLNDAAASLYTDTAILPHLSAAYDELCQRLELNGTSHLKEIGTAITVAALSSSLTVPSDFVKPIRLSERFPGEDDTKWVPMTEQDWEPLIAQTNSIRYWAYREDSIKLLPATVIKEVLLYYYKSLTPITTNAIVIPIVNSKRFLALRTAALAAEFIGMNPILASKLDSKAENAFLDLAGNNLHERQGRPVRRKGFMSRRRRQFFVTG